MNDEIYDLGAGFWSIRGSFIKNGIIDIGVQCALIKRPSGRFIFLDSYTLTGDVRQQVMALTNEGRDVEAVLNVHPFHTVHCAQMAQDFPQATFYGSNRHPQQVPEVSWADDLVESDAVAERYPELQFSIPKGIHYIAPNENVHASSLLVYHPASQSIYVDDTFEIPPSKLFNTVQPNLGLHPTTKKALKEEPNAGKHYCDWAVDLAHEWRNVRHFCGAHSGLMVFEEGQFEAALLSVIDNTRHELENQ
ncbi:hypothetical protein NJD71_08445 [Psychrobacter sp. PP-21]|uniref:hypothetical protein n=1 Tax=Psychrobacter sp. PP-21 TaxID=2957503 RepID=UPI0029B48236|nr:hypothetical protein [Psychrobacter sp. PP-21]MDX2374157.1 hypothetical protein [Psychrobacter sp. PP-21]